MEAKKDFFMKELIKITNQNNIKTVNARELHDFLESKRRFSDWIKQRINKYGFVENEDYTKVSQKNDTFGGPQQSIEYYISIDMAKELSMVENNDRGRKVRIYFITCERELKQSSLMLPNFNNPAESARAWADQYEKREAAEYKVSILRPKANLADKALRDPKQHFSIRDAGKHIGLRQSEIFKILRSNNLLTKKRLPTQKAIDENVLIIRSEPDKDGRNWPQALMSMENIYNFNNKYNQFKLEA